MAHSGKTMTFATDLVPQEDNIYNLGNSSQRWKIYGDVQPYTTRIYPVLGTTGERSAWYKITFPYHNATTGSAAKWFMNSFDLHFGGGYNSNPSGVAHISFYWTRAANNGAWTLGQGAAHIEGILANKIIFYYRVAEPGVLYVCNSANVYNGIWLDNLYVDDTSPSLDWSTTKIETTSAITANTNPALSAYTVLSTTYLYNSSGTLKTDSNFEGKYIKGTWLYTSAATAKTSTTKLATIESDNFIYYITPANALKSAVGTTAIGAAATPIYWDGSKFAAGTALGTASTRADSYFIQSITSTDEAIVRFNGTAGQVQDSKVTINDNGTITLPTEQDINLRMNRKNAQGGGWAHGYLNWYDNADNIFAVMGLYGTNDALDHIYIGSNTSYNSDVNLQIYANGTIKGKLFSGSGASLTNLPAGQLTGTLSMDRIAAGAIANGKLANSKVTIAGNDVSLGGSLTAATLTSSLGLSNALHFIGITSTTLTDGSTTATLTAKSTNSLSKTTGFVDGDVVMDGNQLREYVWSGSAWRLLGITTSTAYTQPASTATNTWIAQVSQGTDGKITATTGSLNTSGTWSGNAGTATKLSTNASNTTASFWRGDNAWSSTLTGSITISKAGECGLEVINSQATNPHKGFFGGGSSGNLGIYDRTYNKWIVYSDPSGNAVLNGNANTATSAGKWTTARTLTIGSTGKSVDGSGNVSWSLAEIGAAASSHTHPVSQLTWGGGVNLATTATANNQEWSIDLSPGTYTGTYWHVWSTPKGGSILTCHPDDRHVTMPGNIASTSTSTGTLQVTGGIGATGQITATRLAANGSDTAYNLYVNGPSYSNINAYMPYQLSLDNPKVSRKLTEHNTSSYRHWIVLLLPYQTATNTGINNYIHGHIHFKKTGSNIYDEVFISANLCYNQLKYRLETYGDGGENAFTPISCIYNGVKYFALKCYDHDNPWTEIYFDGYCISAYPGGNNTTTKPLTLPYIVNYKGNGTQSGSQTIVNTEINNSISTILTDSIVTTATRYYPYMNINGSASSVPWSGVSDRPTNLNQFTNGPGYVTSSGVTSITLKAGTGIKLDTDNTAITSTGTRTISINGVNTSSGSETTCLTAKGTWKAFNNYSLPTAKNDTLGGVKPWYSHTAASTGPTTGSNATAVAVNAIQTTAGRYYAIESDSNGRLFVNVPWTNVNNSYVTTDTKNTAGSTDSTSKLFLIGATSQAANPQTYSDSHVFETNGAFSAKTLGVNADTDNDKVTLQWNSTDNSLDFVFA